MKTSGIGGSMTLISGENILPNQKGAVEIIFNQDCKELNPPKVKSDSRIKFLGTIGVSFGAEESLK